MTTLKRKETVLSQHHLGLKRMEEYKMRAFTNAKFALPDHDCFCALLVHSYWYHFDENDERDQYYAAMGYFFADEQKFYFGFPKFGEIYDSHEYEYIADTESVPGFSVHDENHFREGPEEDWADDIIDVLAWCEVDAFSATGEDI